MRQLLCAIALVSSFAALPAIASAAPNIVIQNVTVACRYWKGKLSSLTVTVKTDSPSFNFFGSNRYFYLKNGTLPVAPPMPGAPASNPQVLTLSPAFAAGPGPYTVRIHDNPNGTPIDSNLFDFTAAMPLCPTHQTVGVKPTMSVLLTAAVHAEGPTIRVVAKLQSRARHKRRRGSNGR